jgi:hypothetical protein
LHLLIEDRITAERAQNLWPTLAKRGKACGFAVGPRSSELSEGIGHVQGFKSLGVPLCLYAPTKRIKKVFCVLIIKHIEAPIVGDQSPSGPSVRDVDLVIPCCLVCSECHGPKGMGQVSTDIETPR